MFEAKSLSLRYTFVTAFAVSVALAFRCLAADATGGTARVRLIAGQAAEKAYLPRLKAVRELDSGTPLSEGERVALLAFLHSG